MRHPGLHVYHYADYERSHLQQLCARHGVGEAILDDLLRDHVLVDLYPVVTQSLRISERSYSLKRLEPLYMGDDLRDGEVTDAAASVDAYVHYAELRREGSAAAADRQLAEIADYNRYDCVSTLRLRDWLLARADEHGVPRRGAVDGGEPADPDLARREDLARDALLAGLEGVASTDRTPEQTALALAAAAIEYHRREDRTFWWEHFDREVAPLDEWADQAGVFQIDAAEVDADQEGGDWARRGRRRSDSRMLRLVGRFAPGTTLKRDCFVMYADPIPDACPPVPAGQRGEHGGAEVVEVRSLPDGRFEVLLEEIAGGDGSGPRAGWRQLPMALTPPRPLATRDQRSAILEWGERLAADLPAVAPGAAADLLRRAAPRVAGGLDPIRDGDAVGAIVSSALRADRTVLAVQGPPGTGKTYVGAHVIAALVRDHGWRVGVVAQSHPVIDHLLQGVLAAGVDPARVGKRPERDAPPGPWTSLARDEAAPFLARHEDGCVLGGTSWVFSSARQVPRGELDLLVVDEAGQYSLANTIAVAASARNLLLLGDPQQLPQVTQGLHPEPVDGSALGWLADGADVLPPDTGWFLAESWRMHPALTAAVSDLAYRGALASREPETTDRRLEGVAPGLHPVPVEHAGDATSSTDEAARVVELVRAHVGRRWTDPSAGRLADPLRPEDVIVVAPYNAQVALLRTALDAAGFQGTPVGTVDRFQGQEAVIAVVSLTASSAADVPRGIRFLLLRNRLNVAISRAQWAAYLVHSPALADYLPRTADGLAELSAFLRLVRRSAGSPA